MLQAYVFSWAIPVWDSLSISDWILLFPDVEEILEQFLLCPKMDCAWSCDGPLEISSLEFEARDWTRDFFEEVVSTHVKIKSADLLMESDDDDDVDNISELILSSLMDRLSRTVLISKHPHMNRWPWTPVPVWRPVRPTATARAAPGWASFWRVTRVLVINW